MGPDLFKWPLFARVLFILRHVDMCPEKKASKQLLITAWLDFCLPSLLIIRGPAGVGPARYNANHLAAS